MATERHFWTVAVTDGWITDRQGRYLRCAIRYDCGHLHRTRVAAEECHERLTATHCGCCGMSVARARALGHRVQSPYSSARWYNSEVLRVDPKGNHAPETEGAPAVNAPVRI